MDATGTVTTAVTNGASEGGGSQTIQVGYAGTVSGDVAAFEGSLSTVAEAQSGSAMKTLLEPLDSIDTEAAELLDYAENAVKSGNELSPSEIVMLTAKSQEFMFHTQLTANIANRTADGLSQLFRQQS